MEASDSTTYRVEAAANGGDGIVRIDGAVCFVRDAVPGDTVRLRDVQRSRGAVAATVAEVVEPSEHRIAPGCPVFDRCGGCSWLHFAYPGQADAKRGIVHDSFRRIAGHEVSPGWIEDPTLRTGYRTRATLHAGETGWGFYARGSHDVVAIDACPLAHPTLNDAIAQLANVPADADLTLTANPDTGQVMAWADSKPDRLASVFPEIQFEGSAGGRNHFTFDGVPIVNGAFAQSSLLLNRMLRERVEDHLVGVESLLDLYCGSGNFSVSHADAAEVVGVDATGPAIMAAMRATGGDYRIGKEAEMVALVADRAWDVVVLDPPRAGAKRVAKALKDSAVKRIVYVSCDPATLARDAKILLGAGWSLTAVDVVDMFPNTPHVETVARFDRE